MQALAILVTEAGSGENKMQRHDAFAELVQRFQGAAYTWAYSILNDTHQAQDAIQEAFVVAYQELPKLRNPNAFASWFRQIVFSQSHRLLRVRRPETKPIEGNELLQGDATPAQIVERMELQDNVMAAVRALPEHEKEVTEMFYLGGYSQKEIAKMLELPLTTVKKRLQYARKHLRQIMVATFAPAPEPVPVLIPVRVNSRYPARRSRYR